jgi:hypothetical protein
VEDCGRWLVSLPLALLPRLVWTSEKILCTGGLVWERENFRRFLGVRDTSLPFRFRLRLRFSVAGEVCLIHFPLPAGNRFGVFLFLSLSLIDLCWFVPMLGCSIAWHVVLLIGAWRIFFIHVIVLFSSTENPSTCWLLRWLSTMYRRWFPARVGLTLTPSMTQWALSLTLQSKYTGVLWPPGLSPVTLWCLACVAA